MALENSDSAYAGQGGTTDPLLCLGRPHYRFDLHGGQLIEKHFVPHKFKVQKSDSFLYMLISWHRTERKMKCTQWRPNSYNLVIPKAPKIYGLLKQKLKKQIRFTKMKQLKPNTQNFSVYNVNVSRNDSRQRYLKLSN